MCLCTAWLIECLSVALNRLTGAGQIERKENFEIFDFLQAE